MYAARFTRPASSFDEIEIRTSDGVTLRAVCCEPEAARATVVLAHGLFGRKSRFDAVTPALATAGFRTVAFDFRDGDFEALMGSDLPAVVECVRARADGHPVIVVAQSLGARVAMAAQTTGRMTADALVLLGGSAWWSAASLTPLALRFRRLSGAWRVAGSGPPRVPVVTLPRRLDVAAVCAGVERAFAQARP